MVVLTPVRCFVPPCFQSIGPRRGNAAEGIARATTRKVQQR